MPSFDRLSKQLRRFTLRLAQLTAQRPEEQARLGDRTSFFGLGAILLLIGAPVLGMGIEAEIYQMGRLGSAQPVVRIQPSQWKTLYLAQGEAPACGSADCPAALGESLLWESPTDREGLAHQERVNRIPKGTLWLGATIPPLELARAAAAGANVVFLGYPLGTFEIFFDGQSVRKGSYRQMSLPINAWIPYERLGVPKPLHIAIRIVSDIGAQFPDGLGFDRGEGLTTPAQADAMARMLILNSHTTPLAIFAVTFTVAIAFALLWLGNRRRPEYAFLSAYALNQALFHFISIDAILSVRSILAWHRFNLSCALGEAALGLLLGLSFSRARRGLVATICALSVLLAIAIPQFFHAPVETVHFHEWFQRWVIPFAYALGGLSCFGQHLRESGRLGGTAVRGRRLGLPMLGFSLLLVGLLYGVEASTITSRVHWTTTFRLANFVILIGSALGAFREYKRRIRLLDRIPISKYHRAHTLPDQVRGTMLCFDLKGSERLLRVVDGPVSGARLLEECIGSLWNVISSHGGQMLQTEGDGFKAFFDDEDRGTRPSLVRAAEALAEIETVLRELEAETRRTAEFSGFHWRFRACLKRGAIRPILQNVSGRSHPGWSEAGRENVFVDSARLLELSRKLEETGALESLLVMDCGEADVMESVGLPASIRAIDRGVSLEGKHGEIYLVTWFRITSSGAAELARIG